MMSRKFFYLSLCMGLMFIIWGVVNTLNHQAFNGIIQAMPVIRFERVDNARHALIIGLFNPGNLPMEIHQTRLFYQRDSEIPILVSNPHGYGNKPLVLDPGDTILVPLQEDRVFYSQLMEPGRYWGELEFKIPQQADIYSLRHPFNRHFLIH